MIGRYLLVFGSGGHGKVVADVAQNAGFRVAGFIDDTPARQGTEIWGLPVMSFETALQQQRRWRRAFVALGVGDNAARERCADRIADAGFEIATLIHPRASLARQATIGEGTVVMAGAAINPDAFLGPGCIINTGAVVEHDCRLGGYVHLSPNAALGGAVVIGDRSHLGLGAVALPGVRIGADVRVGAGAAVIHHVVDGSTTVGVPARALRARVKIA
jgi:sugar O-acyltransferase (sialic acid O-acetyltransferase NeuD family)